MQDLISRQAAIDAIQQHRENVLGSYEYDEGVAFVYAAAHNHIIDVIKRLPSAQPIDKDTDVPSNDCISRAAAIYVASGYCHPANIAKELAKLPSAQPEQTDCEYCHEDSDGYVKPIEKNNHAFVRFGMNGWELDLKANGWHGSAKIMYCPMCGRRLKHG